MLLHSKQPELQKQTIQRKVGSKKHASFNLITNMTRQSLTLRFSGKIVRLVCRKYVLFHCYQNFREPYCTNKILRNVDITLKSAISFDITSILKVERCSNKVGITYLPNLKLEQYPFGIYEDDEETATSSGIFLYWGGINERTRTLDKTFLVRNLWCDYDKCGTIIRGERID